MKSLTYVRAAGLAALVSILTLGLIACSTTDSATPDTGGTPGADGGTPTPDSAVPAGDGAKKACTGATFDVTGKVTRIQLGVTVNPPAVGADVSVNGIPGIAAVKSGADGTYTLKGVCADQDLLIIYKAASHISVAIVWGAKAATKVQNATMVPTSLISVLASGALPAGTTVDVTTKGAVFFAASKATKGEPGVSVTKLTPVSGIGPLYRSDKGLGLLDKTLTMTTTQGSVVYVNVDPGDYELGWSGKTCTTDSGWKGSAAGKLKMKVIAGHASTTTVECQ